MSEKVESKSKGLDTITQNSMLVENIANDIATTIGPKGMDKLIIYDNSFRREISNDGAFIIQSMNIDHPVADMLKDVARTQESEVGDGTSTSIVLSGALLSRARKLRNMPYLLHPQRIITSYENALNLAIQEYYNISRESSKKDFKNIIKTVLEGKLASNDIIINKLTENLENINKNIHTIKIKGSNSDSLEFINGFIIDKEIIHKNMPKEKKDANIMLLVGNLEYRIDNASTQYNISNAETALSMLELENKMSEQIANKIKEANVNLILMTGSISELVKDYLSRAGVSVIRRISEKTLVDISKITNANIIAGIDNIQGNLGKCNFSTIVKNEEEYIIIENKNYVYKTIIIEGSSDYIMKELERGLDDTIKIINSINKDNRVVVGAGASELYVANRLREHSYNLNNIEQLIYQEVAEAIEVIPMVLSMSSGVSQYDLFLSARAENKTNHKIGIDVINGEARDMSEVIEPLLIKTTAINSAKEFVKSILRIDHILVGDPNMR